MKLVEIDSCPRLCLFALTDLQPGTELRYDYGVGNYTWRTQVGQQCLLIV